MVGWIFIIREVGLINFTLWYYTNPQLVEYLDMHIISEIVLEEALL